MSLIVLAIAWLVGILSVDLFHIGYSGLAGVLVLGVLVTIAGRRAAGLKLAGLALCCAALGGARLDAAQVQTTPQSIWTYNERGDLTLEGVVADDPKRTGDGQRLLVLAERVIVGGRARAAEGLVLAKLPAFPERGYGDRVRLTGALTTPREAERPGQFDYRAYLARKRIFSLMEPKAVRVLAEHESGALWSALLGWRDRARRVLLRELPEPQASLAVGILLGLQSSIPDDVSADFSATGTSHILVISGWNEPVNQYHHYRVASCPAEWW
jgi:competence protein ComEC